MPYELHSDVLTDGTAEKRQGEERGLRDTAHIPFSEKLIQSRDNKGNKRNGGKIGKCRRSQLIHCCY